MVGLFKTKQVNGITKRASDIAKQVDDTLITTKENSTKETVVLAYRTNDELRAVCRKEIESLEHWARRLIHSILTENYGKEYFSYKFPSGEPLIKKEIATRVEKMHTEHPERYPRLIDAMFLGDISYILCKESLYNAHFRIALIETYPQGNEEVRIFLERIEIIRNKLSHANEISIREAERAICYCHDFIDGLKQYYRETGKEKDYNVPTFIKATDSLGNIFLPTDGAGPLQRYIDTSTPIRVCDANVRVRSGDLYSISVEIDPAFDASQYSIEWRIEGELIRNSYRKRWKNTSQIDIPIENRMVGSSLKIRCILKSAKDWHKYNWYDDMFEHNIYTILPPIEENY